MRLTTASVLWATLCLQGLSACSDRRTPAGVADGDSDFPPSGGSADNASGAQLDGDAAGGSIPSAPLPPVLNGDAPGAAVTLAEVSPLVSVGDAAVASIRDAAAAEAVVDAAADAPSSSEDAGDPEPLLPDTATVQDFALAAAACPGDSGLGTPYACWHDSNDPALQSPAILKGSGRDPTSFLRLATVPPAGVHDNNSIAFAATGSGVQPLLVADFDFRITPVEGRGRADGLGFALLNTSVYPAGAVPPLVSAEEPSFVGSLGIGFDIYKYPGEGDVGNENILPTFSDSISIHYDGQVLAQLDVERVSDLGNGLWHHAQIVVRQSDAGAALDIWLTPPCGERFPIVQGFSIPQAVPFEARAWFGARTGGEAAQHDLAHVRFLALPADTSWISFAEQRFDVQESDGSVSVTLRREGNLSRPASVHFETRDLGATAGSDYEAAAGTATFAAGEAQQTVTIRLLDDAEDETRLAPVLGRAELAPDVSESFQLVLTALNGGASVAGPALAEVVTSDDEGARKWGTWGAPMCWRIIPMHAHVVPQTGHVLFWDRLGGVAEWTPGARTSSLLAGPGYNLFCAGHALLPDGQLLISGGHDDPLGASVGHDGLGLDNLSVFDATQLGLGATPWRPLPAMNAPRWYPTVTILSDGNALLISGSLDIDYHHNLLPEVYEPATGTLRELTGAMDAAPHGGQLYPFMFSLPDAQVAKVGPDADAWLLDSQGVGAWTPGPTRADGQLLDYGSAVLINQRALVFGGGGADPASHGPVHLTAELDLGAQPLAWKELPPMTIARRQHNATLLPDGRVFVSGGSSAAGFSNRSGAAYPAETFDGNAWTGLPAAAVQRLYHSSAFLLPDGSVVTGGGGEGAGSTSFQSNAEIYYPDYWFKARPALLGPPAEIAYDVPFDLTSSSPIERVTLIRLASVTHSFDQNQRFMELTFTRTAEGVRAVVPSDGWVPPGHYTLFVLDPANVPSRGAIVHVGN